MKTNSVNKLPPLWELEVAPGPRRRSTGVSADPNEVQVVDHCHGDDPLQDQIAFVKVMQEKMERTLTTISLTNISTTNYEDEIRQIKKNLKLLKSKSKGMLVLIQVMLKVKNELTHAKFDLEKAIKFRQGIEQAQKRVSWLEARLHKLLSTSKTMCILELETESKQSIILKGVELSPALADGFNEEQKARLFYKERSLIASPDRNVALITKDLVETSIERVLTITSQDNRINVVQSEVAGPPLENIDELNILDLEKSERSESPGRSINSPYPILEYWNSEHHRFDWTNFMQKLDHLSWHAIPISFADSFLKRGSSLSTSELPWKRKPKLTEPADFHKLALEKLQKKLQKMYTMIENASLHSVNDKLSPTSGIKGGHRSPRHGTKTISFNYRDKEIKDEINSTLFKGPTVNPYDEGHLKLRSRPVSVTFPVVRQDPSKVYPRQPTIWCDTNTGNVSSHLATVRRPRETVKTHPRINHQTSRQKLPNSQDTTCHTMKMASQKVRAMTLLKKMAIAASATDENNLKWKRIQYLLSDSGIESQNNAIALDTIKCFAQLGCDLQIVIDALIKKVEDVKERILGYEASKALLRLGVWNIAAMKLLISGLEKGNRDSQLDILKSILEAKNAQFIKRSNAETIQLIDVLTSLVFLEDDEISLEASLCLGHMCIMDLGARRCLLLRLKDSSFKVKARALRALVKQMNCKTPQVINALLNQLSSATNWKHRAEAADLLLYIGPEIVISQNADRMFDISERLLWDHPCRELREKMAKVLDKFGMKQRACVLVDKRLDAFEEITRVQGIISLVSLRLKGERELKTLLDMLELDSSPYVRIQVIRAFSQMEWNDARVIRSLQEREKGEGALALEARRVLKVIANLP